MGLIICIILILCFNFYMTMSDNWITFTISISVTRTRNMTVTQTVRLSNTATVRMSPAETLILPRDILILLLI